jgi:hypothetical protein
MSLVADLEHRNELLVGLRPQPDRTVEHILLLQKHDKWHIKHIKSDQRKAALHPVTHRQTHWMPSAITKPRAHCHGISGEKTSPPALVV